MEFDSFEQALHICMNAEADSELQDAALAYCLVHAPPELRARLEESLAAFHRHTKDSGHGSGCGCGCDHEH
ncbi:MAG: hypothetical protein ACOY3Z_03850 [Thermodesulfobacteriota bacterium]